MSPPTRRVKGFSLVELLIVIGIIVLLVGILLPVVAWVRSSANSTRCLSNLQQLGQAFQAYLSANHNHSIPRPNGRDPKHLEWWDDLAPERGGVRAVMLCPDAVAIPAGPFRADMHYKRGSAHECWVTERDMVRGSYGFNSWLFGGLLGDWGISPDYFRFPMREAYRIPVFGDAIDFRPLGPDLYSIDRHRAAVNIVFLDGHGERVPVTELGKLKWSSTYHVPTH